tara:strand:- start:118 stop:303 length:186 start_codon:yes stop_codon:yes gene_type:complete
MGENKSSSIGMSGIIFLIFLVMKLGGIGMVADWSWWWVTSPLWIGVILFLILFFILMLIKK